MATLISLNEISIKKKINQKLAESRYQKFAFNAANARFLIGKQVLLESYDKSPVIKELADGPAATTSILPRGNYFSFLGFPFTEKPEQELREMIRNGISMDPNGNFAEKPKSVNYSFKVRIPTNEELYAETPLPWSSLSWIKAIEGGFLQNFGQYVYHLFFSSDHSRSTTGLQNKKANLPGSAPGIPFLIPILEAFRARFRK